MIFFEVRTALGRGRPTCSTRHWGLELKRVWDPQLKAMCWFTKKGLWLKSLTHATLSHHSRIPFPFPNPKSLLPNRHPFSRFSSLIEPCLRKPIHLRRAPSSKRRVAPSSRPHDCSSSHLPIQRRALLHLLHILLKPRLGHQSNHHKRDPWTYQTHSRHCIVSPASWTANAANGTKPVGLSGFPRISATFPPTPWQRSFLYSLSFWLYCSFIDLLHCFYCLDIFLWHWGQCLV